MPQSSLLCSEQLNGNAAAHGPEESKKGLLPVGVDSGRLGAWGGGRVRGR